MADYNWSNDGRLLGAGADGQVRVGRHKTTGEEVAIKKLNFYENLHENLLTETEIMEDVMDHPNVVKLLGLTTNDEGTFMVLELMERDLLDLIASRKLRGDEVKAVMKQILEALCHIHARGIVHQDMKSSNVLVKSEPLLAKLTDFSLARRVANRPSSNDIGTLDYNAPELLRGAKKFGTEIDIWSAGCIFAELLLGGKHPFAEENDEENDCDESLALDRLGILANLRLGDECEDELELDGEQGRQRRGERILRRIRGWSVERVRDRVADPKALELLRRLLTVDPRRRISARDALKMAYFQASEEKGLELHRALPAMATRTENFRPAWILSVLFDPFLVGFRTRCSDLGERRIISSARLRSNELMFRIQGRALREDTLPWNSLVNMLTTNTPR